MLLTRNFRAAWVGVWIGSARRRDTQAMHLVTTDWKPAPGWAGVFDPAADLALIRVGALSLGAFGFDDRGGADIEVEVTGFDAFSSDDQRRRLGGTIRRSTSGHYAYRLPTGEGMSGSPVWRSLSGSPVVVGVHQNSSNAAVQAVRLTPAHCRWIQDHR